VPRRPEPASKDPIELPPSFPTVTLHSIQADEATVSEELGIVHHRTRLSPPLATNRLRPTIKEHRRSPPTPCQSLRPCQPIATKNFQVSPTLSPTSAPSISSFAPPFSNYFKGEQLWLGVEHFLLHKSFSSAPIQSSTELLSRPATPRSNTNSHQDHYFFSSLKRYNSTPEAFPPPRS
jgi:hypothetical protein